MKSYKEYKTQNIGLSVTLESLLLLGCQNGIVVPQLLPFNTNDRFSAYVVDEEAEIDSSFHVAADFDEWLRIYDNDALANYYEADRIIVYRDSENECIIQLIGSKD